MDLAFAVYMLNVISIIKFVESLSVILALSCVCRWNHHPTTGQPPLGVIDYACSSISHSIFYFAGYCSHDECRHNSFNVLNVDYFTWEELFSTSDTTGPMKKSGSRMLAFYNQLLAVGGVGVSFPKDPSPSATYEKLGDFIFTNEHHIYDTEEG